MTLTASDNNKHFARPARIALINPTKFLGNLLIAGDLMQFLSHWCAEQDIALLIMLDDRFRDLFVSALPGVTLVYYPRSMLSGPGLRWQAIREYWRCVSSLRAFRADLAFTIEEDSVCHRLTHLSGARRKVSSTPHRYRLGFDQVLSVARSGRKPNDAHIWCSFRDIFSALDLPVPSSPAYARLQPPPPSKSLAERLQAKGLSGDRPLAVLHAGASKAYKKWPEAYFVSLGYSLMARGYQLALIGAGRADAEVNTRIMTEFASGDQKLGSVSDLCNDLDLAELATFMTTVSLMIGNDSGPSHLASALGVRGAVIFGPTDPEIWRPLGAQTEVLENKSVCEAECTRHHCNTNYFCLRSVTPDKVMSRLFPGVSA
jgi:ADP-heptose:LPS heptosyltransferase